MKQFSEACDSIRMSTTFMNPQNSKISDLHRLRLNLIDKMDVRRSDKYVALSELSIFYKWKNIKRLYKSNKFKISGIK